MVKTNNGIKYFNVFRTCFWVSPENSFWFVGFSKSRPILLFWTIWFLKTHTIIFNLLREHLLSMCLYSKLEHFKFGWKSDSFYPMDSCIRETAWGAKKWALRQVLRDTQVYYLSALCLDQRMLSFRDSNKYVFHN